MTPLRRTLALVAFAALAAVQVTPATAAAHDRPHPREWKRLATFPAHLNSSAADPAAAEIATVTGDGRTVVYTDSPGERLGFVDITDPARPRPAGTLAVGGEPTSVARLGGLLLAAVNTSVSFTDPSGELVVIDARTRGIRRTIDLGGQPDAVAVAPGGRYVAVAVENERDEDVADGALPQLPAGFLAVLDTRTWAVTRVDLTGLAGVAPGDPEPEYVSVNDRAEAVVSLQENNHLAIVDLRTATVVRHFPAGTVTVTGVDTEDDNRIVTDDTITAEREPDGVAWLGGTGLFATANEGDYQGGSRGWSIFDRSGRVVWDAGNSLERIAVEHGLYPDSRSDAKGIEPENVAYAEIRGVPYVFVNAERGNFTAVYDVTRPRAPRFLQVLPTTNGPEGVVAVPSRGLLVVSSEEDLPDDGIRSSVQIYGLGNGVFPSIVSRDGIPWGALSGLSAVPGRRHQLVTVTDAVYDPTRLLTVDTARRPATIVRQLTVTRDGVPVGYDAEGVVARRGGGYWLAVEPSLILRLDAAGAVREEIPLPPIGVTANGLEGIAEVGTSVWVAVQRAVAGDPAGIARIGRYDTVTRQWSWLGYPLDTATTGWVGLSELVAVDHDTFAVVERDNQRGPAASIKRIYRFDVLPTWTGLPTVRKQLVRDLLPALRADNGWVQDKVEGLAVGGDGRTYAVTDNDGLDDATGETVFLRLGRLL